MSTRQNIQQIVSPTAPTNIVTVGDEWFNPTTNRLYKSLLFNGRVQWTEIPLLGTSSTFLVSGQTVFGPQPLDTSAYDPFFNKVDVLMHFDGNVENAALSGQTGTLFSTVGGSTFPVFSTGTFMTAEGRTGAIRFRGSSGNDYVRVGNYGVQDNQLTGDFTIELWFTFEESLGGSFQYRTLLSKENNSGSSWMFFIYNQQQINFNTQGLSQVFNWNQGLYFTQGVWYHIAVVRQSGVIRFYVNGIQQTTTLTSSEPISGPWRVGAYSDTVNYRWNGRIDELRITRDVARYTANFSPPTQPFPDAQYPTSVAINYPTVSFNSSTGALVVQGGIATRGDLNVAGDIRSYSQIRAPYFWSNDISSTWTSPRSRVAFQVKGPTARTGDFYGAPSSGLGYDSASNFVYLAATDGNFYNGLYFNASGSGAGFYTNSSGAVINMQMSSPYNLQWGSSTTFGYDGAAGILSLRRSTNNTSFYVYNSDGGQTNGSTPTTYDRAVIDWTTTPSQLTMGVQVSAGGGRNIRIVTGSTTATVTIVPTAQSTSTTTGALIVSGGLGVAGNIYSGGNIVGITKSFLIDHPTKPHKKLQYASLEGPENGVYVRGRITNTSIIELPDYWTALVDHGSISATLTPIGRYQELWIEHVKGNLVTVNSTSQPIDCFYTVYGERKDIGKLTVEPDK